MRPRLSHRLGLAVAIIAAVACAPREAPAPPLSLPWIENDWPAALSQARARQVPIFIEAWAPW